MATITNKWGLPPSLTRALAGDDYDMKNAPQNVFSITRLVDSPKYRELQKRHNHEVEEDVSERLWVLMGHSIHYVLQAGNEKAGGNLSEERIFIRLLDWSAHTLRPGQRLQDALWYTPEDTYVSCRIDNYDEAGVVEDYKTTSVWSAIFNPEGKPEHIAQVNVGAFALRQLGFGTSGCRIVQIMRDWKQTDAAKKPDEYPQIPAGIIDCPVWEDEYVREWIAERVKLHMAAMTMEDDQIPECSKDERWNRPGKLAVMKNANKTAFRLFDNTILGRSMAEQCIRSAANGKDKFYIVERPESNSRCEGYCKFNQFCHFGRTQVTMEEVNG